MSAAAAGYALMTIAVWVLVSAIIGLLVSGLWAVDPYKEHDP